MGQATLNIKVAPRRMLTAREAAEYCGLSAKRFGSCGIKPVTYPNGELLYDIQDLDRWIDGLKEGASDSDDAIIARLG